MGHLEADFSYLLCFEGVIFSFRCSYRKKALTTHLKQFCEIDFCTYLVPFSSQVEAIAGVTRAVVSLCKQCLQLCSPMWCKWRRVLDVRKWSALVKPALELLDF